MTKKKAFILTGISELSWPVTPTHLLGCIFQTVFSDSAGRYLLVYRNNFTRNANKMVIFTTC